MNRRTLLSNAGLALAGLGMGACAPKARALGTPAIPAPGQSAAARRPMVQLPLVRVSAERVIRRTVGLRPHRPTGFVLKSAALDHKTLIHNYGHGGSGMSLSWGTAAMAADMALSHGERRAAVLGSGVVGLTTARQLQRRGFAVTIYAAHVPPDVTSNFSLAAWTPTSGLVEFSKRTTEWSAQLVQAAEIGYRQLQFMAGPRYGISWITNYAPTESAESARGENALLPRHLQSEQTLLQPGEHPFPTTYAIERPELRIEPNIYLPALMDDVLAFGGQIVVRTFESPRDVLALSENLIVNCTGLGAKALFGDDELTPLKGLLVLLPPQPDVHYSTSGGWNIPPTQRGLFVHMMPRTDGIVLGGTSERGVWSTEVNETEVQRIVDNHVTLFAAMRVPGPAAPSTTSTRR
ncbi:MAG: FAD-dependent oxidoreductase [Acidobacteria bacterium]|nr:FAD-dependent oxidoreductase [Acidobacteriota bacterium]